MPWISIPHKQLIGFGFFIRELCLLVQNFIFLCHFTITTFHFSSGKKIKSTILILLSKVHFLHVILFVDRNPQAAGLTRLCLLSPRICMSYYNSHRGCPAGGRGLHSRRRVGGGGGQEATAPSEVGRRRPSMVLTEALSEEAELKTAAWWRPALFWL